MYGAHSSRKLDIPGDLELVVERGTLTVRGRRGSVEREEWSMELTVPGTVRLPGRLGSLRAVCVPPPLQKEVLRREKRVAFLDREKTAPPLTVRNRREGDRFFPLGAPGEQKLHDFFINRKVPLAERNDLPLLVSGERIAWVGGVEISDKFKLDPFSTTAVEISWEEWDSADDNEQHYRLDRGEDEW